MLLSLKVWVGCIEQWGLEAEPSLLVYQHLGRSAISDLHVVGVSNKTPSRVQYSERAGLSKEVFILQKE